MQKQVSTLLALPAILLTLFLFSCQTALPDQYTEYIGSWGSDRFSMEIWKNGRGVLEWGNRGPYECRIEIDDQKIRFRGEVRRNFTIDQPPYMDASGYWLMELDGDLYYLH